MYVSLHMQVINKKKNNEVQLNLTKLCLHFSVEYSLFVSLF